MSGKGSRPRPEAKPGAYAEGWERTFGKPKKQSPVGRTVRVVGKRQRDPMADVFRIDGIARPYGIDRDPVMEIIRKSVTMTQTPTTKGGR